MTDIETTVKTVDLWEALNLLKRAANQKLLDEPDYVYQPPVGTFCVNLTRDDQDKLVGSCLIGRVFLLLDVEPDSTWATGSFGYVAGGPLVSAKVEFTKEAKFVLQTAQNLQDCKVPWKYCVEAADHAASNMYVITEA